NGSSVFLGPLPAAEGAAATCERNGVGCGTQTMGEVSGVSTRFSSGTESGGSTVFSRSATGKGRVWIAVPHATVGFFLTPLHPAVKTPAQHNAPRESHVAMRFGALCDSFDWAGFSLILRPRAAARYE